MRIAVVEDERKLGNALREGLQSEGYDADLFEDGEAAETALRSSSYTLAILDLGLPKKSGFEVCRDVRAQGATLPILVLTARDAVSDKVAALDAGADDFLTKPFSFDELFARTRALIRRSAPQAARVHTIEDVVLDTGTHTVTRAGEPLALTLKEFELLAYLLEHRTRVVPREELFAELWERDEPGFTNVVDVHIRNLRKKLDDDYDDKIIRTVRGIGYAVAG